VTWVISLVGDVSGSPHFTSLRSRTNVA
jgi:hypothetical protein